MKNYIWIIEERGCNNYNDIHRPDYYFWVPILEKYFTSRQEARNQIKCIAGKYRKFRVVKYNMMIEEPRYRGEDFYIPTTYTF